jgi:hypothetical protein
MTTNVPGVTFGSTGFLVPASSAILTGVQTDLNAAFGGNLNPALNTPQGQMATSFASIIGNVDQLFQYYTNQVDPAFASGRMQDAIARIYFLTRLPSLPTVLQILCTGLNITIPVGALISDTSGNIYSCTGSGPITNGSATFSFAAQIPGPTAVPATVSIYQAIPGWNTVSVVSGVIGRVTETRAQFEARRQLSVAQNSVGSLPSILGAVLSVPNVLDAYATENPTNGSLTIGGVVLVPNSIYVAVVGGSATAVAQAIWSKKAPGCNYNGNTTVVVQDTNSGYSPPLPSYNVTFEIPPALPIYFSITIVNNPQVPSNAVSLIQTAIVNAFAGLDGGPRARIGSTLYSSRYVSPLVALGPWLQLISINLGSSNSSAASFTGSIGANGTMTVSSISSGIIGISQVISGSGITPGTTVISQVSGTTGGVGTYIVNPPQIIGSEAITAIAVSLNSIVVNINQEPTTTASSVQVNLL